MSSLKDRKSGRKVTPGRVKEREKRKARRAAQREANRVVRLENAKLPKDKQQELPYPPKPRPPEPVVFAWMDWARETHKIIHAGRGHGKRERKYRFPVVKGVEIVCMDERRRVMVRLPLSLALEVFGKV